MANLDALIGRLVDRIAALETRFAQKAMVGPVAERDHKKGVRLRLGGTDDKPFLSPWIQPSDMNGTFKSRYLPAKGEQMFVLSPMGDLSQGMAVPYTHSKQNPNPAADENETVFFQSPDNKVRMSFKDGKLVVKNDKTTTTWDKDGVTHEHDGKKLTINKDGSKFEGGKVQHDAKNIGKDHKHTGVQSGSGNTGDPDA